MRITSLILVKIDKSCHNEDDQPIFPLFLCMDPFHYVTLHAMARNNIIAPNLEPFATWLPVFYLFIMGFFQFALYLIHVSSIYLLCIVCVCVHCVICLIALQAWIWQIKLNSNIHLLCATFQFDLTTISWLLNVLLNNQDLIQLASVSGDYEESSNKHGWLKWWL